MVVNWRSMNEEEKARLLEQIRPKGEWIKNVYGECICSKCYLVRRDNRCLHVDFCNACGADMRESNKHGIQ